ncbi:MAG TPA: ATP-dependent DNA ligase [Candidatus Tumulicola sp.]|jgi:DNA ligase-1
MERFAQAAETVAARSGRLEKIAGLAEYLRQLEDDDLVAAVRFFTGRPFAARDDRTLSLGGATIARVASRLWGFGDAELRAAYRATGDLGAALGKLVRPPSAMTLLPAESLAPASLARIFDAIADIAGKNANARREAGLERILRTCVDPLVAAYVVKIVTGDLRIGLREGLVVDAIAQAFAVAPEAVRRAVMASGDVGAAAAAAKRGTLADVRVAHGAPIGFMLASPISCAPSYPQLAGNAWTFEDKYDGIRVQAHVGSETVRLFSRTLNDVSGSYPEVTRALADLRCEAVFDGEIVAMRDGRVLPFRHLQARLRRKRLDDELLREVPLTYVAFDLLAVGDALLLDEPYVRRRARLATLVPSNGGISVAPFAHLGEAADVNALFEAARARGNEGLMIKRADSPYVPGRRGKWWYKLKRELATLDAVVIAVEWGHGKRSGVLSDYTFAVRDGDRFAAIGKAYSGLTDAEIAELTRWFLEHKLPDSRRRINARSHEIPVRPQVVLEIAFDVVQKSDLHESGFALRFPRIVRIRDDKPPEEIDTLARVREIYDAMLRRESGDLLAVDRQPRRRSH